MRLTVLGSGSRGNSVLFESAGDALLVDAGFSLRDLLRRFEAAGRDPQAVRAVVVTHEHGDHARGAARAAATFDVPLLGSRGTLEALAPSVQSGTPTVPLPPTRRVACGALGVTAYPTAHDAAEPVMVVVDDSSGRRVAVAYDLGSPTAVLRVACRDLDGLVIETNHDEIMLRASGYPPAVRARIAGRGGHLSNREAGALAAEVAHAGLGTVILAHLSDRCNRPDLALSAVRDALAGSAFAGELIVASQEEPSATIEIGRGQRQLALPL